MQIFPFHHHYIADGKPTEGTDNGHAEPSRDSHNVTSKTEGTEERPAESIDNCCKNLRKRTFEINSKQILYYDETERNQ